MISNSGFTTAAQVVSCLVDVQGLRSWQAQEDFWLSLSSLVQWQHKLHGVFPQL